MVNKPLIRPYFLGGSFGGRVAGSQDSHDKIIPGGLKIPENWEVQSETLLVWRVQCFFLEFGFVHS